VEKSAEDKEMKIRKLCGSIAVAISMFALSGTASAEIDCNDLVGEIQTMARELRCNDTVTPVGWWPTDNAIWQWKGKGEMGCELHQKHARLLDEERTESPPEKKKGNNIAKGAANDLLDGKNQSAYDQLTLFIDRIIYDAKLNGDFDPIVNDPRGTTAQSFADYFVNQASLARSCIVLPPAVPPT
jgi:hypothetical protein